MVCLIPMPPLLVAAVVQLHLACEFMLALALPLIPNTGCTSHLHRLDKCADAGRHAFALEPMRQKAAVSLSVSGDRFHVERFATNIDFSQSLLLSHILMGFSRLGACRGGCLAAHDMLAPRTVKMPICHAQANRLHFLMQPIAMTTSSSCC